MKVFSEDEWIDCPKCGRRFKVNTTTIGYFSAEWVDGDDNIVIACPRCKNRFNRLPLDHEIE